MENFTPKSLSLILIFFVEFKGQSHRSNSNRNTVKQTQAVLRRWCQASRIWGFGMVFMIRPGVLGFTTAGRVRIDSGWSWTLQFARVTLHDGKVAPLTSQTLARAIFFALWSWLSSHSNFDLGLSRSDSREKIYQIRAYDFGVQFTFNGWLGTKHQLRFLSITCVYQDSKQCCGRNFFCILSVHFCGIVWPAAGELSSQQLASDGNTTNLDLSHIQIVNLLGIKKEEKKKKNKI